MSYREVPQIEYKQSQDKLMNNYILAYQSILTKLLYFMNINASTITIQQQQSLLKQVGVILNDLNAENKPLIEKMVREIFTEAQAQTILSLGDVKTLEEARKGVSHSALVKHTADTLVADTFNDLLQMTDRTNEKVKRIVREVVAAKMRVNAMQNIGRKHTVKEVYNELINQGLHESIMKELDEDKFMGVTDRAGRRWKLKTYVEMVVRTKLQQAHTEGVRTEAAERGVDLAIISNHGAEDSCRHFEKLIISMNGTSEGYLTYDEIRRSNKCFHPNCKHHVSPLRKFELAPPSIRMGQDAKMSNIRSTGIDKLK